MKWNVLVFPCGSEIGLELHRSLAWCKHVELFGASSTGTNHGKYVYKNYIEGLPFVDQLGFIAALDSVIDQKNIHFIYPAHDDVVLKLSQVEKRLSCQVIGSPLETCRTCRSKLLTYQTMSGIVRVPRMYDYDEIPDSNIVFLKPDVGQGAKGTYIAHSKAEIQFYLLKDPTLLILEYLPGAEFTVDCFTDRHGELRFVGGRQRVRVENGISVNTHPIYNSAFREIAMAINRTLHFRGAWFFQLKEASDGDLTLLEIAPRIAGSMALYRNLGINFALLSVYDRLDIDVTIEPNSYVAEMDRALSNRFRIEADYQHVYVDLDDTLLVESKVNVMLVAFLYQCFNRNVRRYLLSRNPGDILGILCTHHLDGIFDAVIQVDPSHEKADYVTESSAIFIDDSFRERCSVAQRCGIPTFDLDAIESLLDFYV